MATNAYARAIWLLAFWAGPSAWVWCAAQIITDSWVVATGVAAGVGFLAMLAWQWASKFESPQQASDGSVL